MAKLLAFLLLAAVMVAVASAQYYAAYPRAVAAPYAYRGAYAPAVGYAGVGAYGYPGRVVYG